MRCKRALLTAFLLLWPTLFFGQANGNLQIHFMNVGQGDGAVLISPLGEVVLLDNGVRNQCDRPISYLQQLGVTKIDYHIASHYHDDHIGCTAEVLREFPLKSDAIDRGGSYHTATYQRYAAAVDAQRKTGTLGMKVVLDANSSSPVTIEIVALNADGIQTTNENDLSLVAVVHFGQFHASFGGDLSGYKGGGYEDIETSVAPKIGQVEIYKVNHHGSRYSSNDDWLSVTKPIVGIVSVGAGNRHRHPTQEALERLHAAGVKTYWTEIGNGADPEPGLDAVGGNIVVEVAPGSTTFTVTHSGALVDTYPVWGAPETPAEAIPTYSWSKRSNIYHHSNCRYVANISPANLEQGEAPPEGKQLHQGCPK